MVIHVVAAALIDPADRVLLAQRPAGRHLAGGWEFPGGKLEPGEARLAGLARELHEEIGITLRMPRPLIRVRHTYPSRDVLLEVWVVRHYRGTPRGLDGQALRWCTREELATVDLLPADGPIARVLWLPERLTEVNSRDYEIVEFDSLGRSGGDRDQGDNGRLRGVFCADASEFDAAIGAGADFLVLRNALADAELAKGCDSVHVPIFARGMGLERAWALGASGLNETSR